MNYLLMIGTTDSNGTLTVTRNIGRPMRLVKVRWLVGDFANGVDAVVSNVGLGSVYGSTIEDTLTVPDRTLLTLTNADTDAWHDVADDDGGGIIDQALKLTVTNGGAGKVGGIIAYLDDSMAVNVIVGGGGDA